MGLKDLKNILKHLGKGFLCKKDCFATVCNIKDGGRHVRKTNSEHEHTWISIIVQKPLLVLNAESLLIWALKVHRYKSKLIHTLEYGG